MSLGVTGRTRSWPWRAGGAAALADMAAASVISPTVARQAGPFWVRVFIFIFWLFEVLGSRSRAPTTARIERKLAVDAPVEMLCFLRSDLSRLVPVCRCAHLAWGLALAGGQPAQRPRPFRSVREGGFLRSSRSEARQQGRGPFRNDALAARQFLLPQTHVLAHDGFQVVHVVEINIG